jgi:phage terminase small subunit
MSDKTQKTDRRLTRYADPSADLGSEQMRRRFVNGMLRWGHLHGGITKAALFAGYSEKTAASTGSKLCQMPEIQEALQAGRERMQDRCNVSPDKIVNALATVAFHEIADIMTWEKNKVTLKDLADMEPQESAAIHSVTETKIRGGGTKLEVKTHDRLRALELLGKTMGMFKEKEDPNKTQIGGVLRVPSRPNVAEWEAQEGVTETDSPLIQGTTEMDLEEEP